MNKKHPSITILHYGAGAVGLGLASFLVKAGADVTLLGRPQTVRVLRSTGLKRTGLFGDFRAAPTRFRAVSSLAQIPRQTFDYILVSTKSFDSQPAAQDIQKHPRLWNKKTKIVLCQNGWGNAEIFSNYLPQKQIFNARIITGFERTKPNEVNITVHADAIHLGSIFTQTLSGIEPLTAALARGGMPTKTVPDIAKDLWAKMLYNCALNSLGAVFDVPYGELGKNGFSRRLMREIMEEIFDVMGRAGYQTHWPTVEQYEKIFYKKFLPPTAGHRSSTLQDLKNSKPTEIDAINGIIVELGNKFDVPVFTNRAVYQMVKFLETRNIPGHKS